jgi:hypothetical protein
MDETARQIEDRIKTSRENLKSNFSELENKVKTATDWRHYFKEHTGSMMAGAFAGGVVLSTLTRKSRRPSVHRYENAPQEAVPTKASSSQHKMRNAFEDVKGALVGVAATKFKSVLSEVVPGFAEHIAKAADSAPEQTETTSAPRPRPLEPS